MWFWLRDKNLWFDCFGEAKSDDAVDIDNEASNGGGGGGGGRGNCNNDVAVDNFNRVVLSVVLLIELWVKHLYPPEQNWCVANQIKWCVNQRPGKRHVNVYTW